MLNEINSLLSASSKITKGSIPITIQRAFISAYPRMMHKIKSNMPPDKAFVNSVKLVGYTKEKMVGFNDFHETMYIQIEYYGDDEDPDIGIFFSEIGNGGVIMPDGLSSIFFNRFKIEILSKCLGPAQKRYETPAETQIDEYESNLEKLYLKYMKAGILKNYYTMLRHLIFSYDKDDMYFSYPFRSGGRSVAAGIINIKYPITVRASTDVVANNYTSIIMDNAEQWKDFPKRRASVCFSDVYQIAASYGEAYYIFPKDDVKIGICPKSDLWATFVLDTPAGNINLHSLNLVLDFLSTRYMGKPLDRTNYDNFKKQISMLDKYVAAYNEEKFTKMHRKFVTDGSIYPINYAMKIIKQSGMSLVEFSEALVRPIIDKDDVTKNYIACTTSEISDVYDKVYDRSITTYYSSIPGGAHELWTDTPCLIVASDAIFEFYQCIVKHGFGE